MQYFLSFHRKIDNKFDEELDDSTIFNVLKIVAFVSSKS